MASDGPKWGWEDLFLLIQTLPTFQAERIWISRTFIFLYCLDPKFSDVQVPKSPNSQFFQVPRFPDAAGGRILRSQPDLSPNAPRDSDQIRRKGPCCD